MLSSMQVGIWGGRMIATFMGAPVSPVWIPMRMVLLSPMQSPNVVCSTNSVVILQSVRDFRIV
jgi:hypothetical protein